MARGGVRQRLDARLVERLREYRPHALQQQV